MKAIVVGHTSMLGRSLCQQLVDRGFEVITAGRSGEAAIYCDFLVQPPRLRPPDQGEVDVLYVLSSAFSDDSVAGIGQNLLVNTGSCSYIFAIAAATSPKLIVFAGSIFSDAHVDPLLGLQSYGLTKRIAEDLLTWWCAKNDVRFVSVRLSQLYDDHGLCVQHQPWIGRIIRYAFEQQDLVMPMSAGKRNFLHVQDAASLFVETALCDSIQGIQNGCCPCDYDYTDLAELAFSYNACMEKLHLTKEKQPFRPLHFPKTDLLFDCLAMTPQVMPERWLERIHAYQSWSDFGPLDVTKV